MSAPVLREYTHTLPGQGIGYVRIYLPVTVGAEDVEDLRTWLELIDRQLERLHARALRDDVDGGVESALGIGSKS